MKPSQGTKKQPLFTPAPEGGALCVDEVVDHHGHLDVDALACAGAVFDERDIAAIDGDDELDTTTLRSLYSTHTASASNRHYAYVRNTRPRDDSPATPRSSTLAPEFRDFATFMLHEFLIRPYRALLHSLQDDPIIERAKRLTQTCKHLRDAGSAKIEAFLMRMHTPVAPSDYFPTLAFERGGVAPFRDSGDHSSVQFATTRSADNLLSVHEKEAFRTHTNKNASMQTPQPVRRAAAPENLPTAQSIYETPWLDTSPTQPYDVHASDPVYSPLSPLPKLAHEPVGLVTPSAEPSWVNVRLREFAQVFTRMVARTKQQQTALRTTTLVVPLPYHSMRRAILLGENARERRFPAPRNNSSVSTINRNTRAPDLYTAYEKKTASVVTHTPPPTHKSHGVFAPPRQSVHTEQTPRTTTRHTNSKLLHAIARIDHIEACKLTVALWVLLTVGIAVLHSLGTLVF